MRSAPANLAVGKAGEYTVAAQLLLRGYTPYLPCVDVGADIIVDGGIRIQVKSTHLRVQSGFYKEQGAYWFKLANRVTMSNGKVKKWLRVFSEECDFVILWGIDTNRFWVIPAAELDGRQLVVVGPDNGFCDVDRDAVLAARDAGKTFRQIAKEMKTCAATILNVANGREIGERYTLSSKVRSYESRWDLIGEYLKLTTGSLLGEKTTIS